MGSAFCSRSSSESRAEVRGGSDVVAASHVDFSLRVLQNHLARAPPAGEDRRRSPSHAHLRQRRPGSTLSHAGHLWLEMFQGHPHEAEAAHSMDEPTALNLAWSAMARGQLDELDAAFGALEKALADPLETSCQRDKAKQTHLPDHREPIEQRPALHDAAIDDAQQVGSGQLSALPVLERTSRHPANEDLLAFRDEVLDRELHDRKSGAVFPDEFQVVLASADRNLRARAARPPRA